MCLFKLNIFPKRAKEDIVCYKDLRIINNSRRNKKYATPFQKVLVIPGKTILKNKISIFWGIFTSHITNEGVHSYLTLNAQKYQYHVNSKIVSFKSIIPKGTWYYEGKYGDLASSKLIITNEKIVGI